MLPFLNITAIGRRLLYMPSLSNLAGIVTGPCNSTRLLSSRWRPPGTRIGETSVFVQTGMKINELPVVVQKVNDVFDLYRKLGISQDKSPPPSDTKDAIITYNQADLNPEEAEVIAGFSRCYSASSIYKLLETIPRKEVTPSVAAHALRKIIDLENAVPSHIPAVRANIGGGRKTQDSFLRIAFVSTLLDIVCSSRKPRVILDGLATVGRDKFPGDQADYKERMLEELLLCVSEGIFSVAQVCEAINILSLFYEDRKSCLEVADKLWFGIVDQAAQIESPDTVVQIISILPHLKNSRSVVFKLAEEKSMAHWQTYSTGDIVEIMRVFTEIGYNSPRLMKMVSQWLSVNIHSIRETELLAILYCFIQLDYVDNRVISSVEKVIKHRGCQIGETDLVSTICDLCTKFRIRSQPILEGTGQYFMEHFKNLSAPQILSIARCYGELDFHPPNGFKFWDILEHLLENKFMEFSPKDIIELLVSFLYIEKYPLNFTNKLFNPFFLDRLHHQKEDAIALSRQHLKLFDTSMKLECPSYGGPYLPKDTHYRQLFQDMRIQRLAGNLLDPLADLVGDITRLGRSVVLSSLPLHPLYIVDLMVYPSQAAALLRFGFRTNNSSIVAILIIMPEHYDRSGENLVGPQVMRKRQLKSMGFKVMTVDYNTANKMLVHPKDLREYLQTQYTEALKEK